jgi:hypothetical protein
MDMQAATPSLVASQLWVVAVGAVAVVARKLAVMVAPVVAVQAATPRLAGRRARLLRRRAG